MYDISKFSTVVKFVPGWLSHPTWKYKKCTTFNHITHKTKVKKILYILEEDKDRVILSVYAIQNIHWQELTLTASNQLTMHFTISFIFAFNRWKSLQYWTM